jgi:hypothetical protein
LHQHTAKTHTTALPLVGTKASAEWIQRMNRGWHNLMQRIHHRNTAMPQYNTEYQYLSIPPQSTPPP